MTAPKVIDEHRYDTVLLFKNVKDLNLPQISYSGKIVIFFKPGVRNDVRVSNGTETRVIKSEVPFLTSDGETITIPYGFQ